MGILDVLFLKHSTWIKYVKSFGCPDDISEDYVQEMYIKIFNYSQIKNYDLMYDGDEVNYFFIYVTLKNMYFDDLRKSKKKIIVSIEDIILIQEPSDYSESKYYYQKDLVSNWIKDLNNEIDSIEDHTEYKASLCYIKFIYQKIFIERYSITDLSEETKLSYWSIRNTVKRIKQQITNGSTRESNTITE